MDKATISINKETLVDILMFTFVIGTTVSATLMLISPWFLVLVYYFVIHSLFGPLDWCLIYKLYLKLRR